MQAEGSEASHVAVGRAIAVVVVAIVLGAILLGVAGRPPTANVSSTSTLPAGTPTTTTHPGATTTTHAGATTTSRPATTTTTHAGATTTTKASSLATPHSSVKTLVANGTTTPNAAGTYTQLLSSQGWSMLSPADTTVPVSSSTVYYATGQQAAATAIATSLGLTASSVKQLTSSIPVSNVSGADVVVVLGPDLAAHLPSTSG
jgi:LytR cell envelope-related transcriptional attenuator